MTTAQIPQSIQASIHQDAINRVSQFFNATTSDILNELLQNARRSGASRVDVTAGDGLVTVTDDGQGISDPTAILAFGQTTWNDQVTLNERPAGIGFYALARCKLVTVRSKTENGNAWQVSLTPDHFVGKLAAPVERLSSNGTRPGTAVTFSSTQTETQLQNEVQTAARNYPLPVHFNDLGMEKTDFLQEAVHIQQHQGVRIGVYKNNNDLMNFHGIVIRHPSLPQVHTIEQKIWTTRADVRDCPQLELTLPARREVVETPFMQELRQACRKAIYQAMNMEPEQVNVPKKVQDDAADMGITMPDAAPRLEPWQPRTANFNHHGPGREYHQATDSTIVMELDLTPANEQALARAARQSGIMDRLYKQNRDLAGYEWYDRLTKANTVRITVTGQDGDREIEETHTERKVPKDQRPDGIVFTLETTREDKEGKQTKLISLPADLAFENDEYDSVYDATPLITRDSPISIHELSELMMAGFFHPSDDPDADSYNTQEDDAQNECDNYAIRMLTSQDDAAKATIVKAIENHVIYHVPSGMTATITVRRGEPVEVTLNKEREC